jgi:transcriptional regulator with XRE-family HTH domain
MGRAPRRRQRRLADKLLQIRLAFGLSQSEILDRMGLSNDLYRTNVSSYERGEREPPLFALLEYARLAGVHVEDLIDDGRDLPDRLPGRVKL